MDGWKVTAIVLIVVFIVLPLVFVVVGGVVFGAAAARVADGTDGGMP
jgi:hypothetical protein